jgi:pimeloyl-ACP methyl ester carboxylesterase
VAQGQTKATVILVHAAWSDGSSWGKVISSLDAFGIKSVAAQLPLKSLREDAHIVRQLMDRQGGPVVLVGHSYGGAVISLAGAGRPEVASLAYIAAIVPDQGETVGAVFTRAAPHAEAPQLAPDPYGLLWVDQRAFDTAIAPGASDGERRLLAAVQKPISGACLGEALDQVAWRSKPVHFSHRRTRSHGGPGDPALPRRSHEGAYGLARLRSHTVAQRARLGRALHRRLDAHVTRI